VKGHRISGPSQRPFEIVQYPDDYEARRGRSQPPRIKAIIPTRHPPVQRLAPRFVELGSAGENIEEATRSSGGRIGFSGEEMGWHSHPDEFDADAPTDLDGENRQGDRDTPTTIEDPIDQRILDRRVRHGIPRERLRAVKEMTDQSIHSRRGTGGGEFVEPGEFPDAIDPRAQHGRDLDHDLIQRQARLAEDLTKPVDRLHMTTVPSTTVRAMFPGAHVATQPDKPAIVMAGTGAVITYAELDAAANRVSRLLRDSGLQPGDHVAVCLENHPRFFEVIWGCHYAGLIYTAASSRLTSEELAYIINDCGARMFITSQYLSRQASEVLESTPDVERRLMLDGTAPGYESYEEVIATLDASPLPDRVAGVDMLYSSGTTGQPKGVLPAFSPTPLGEEAGGVAPVMQMLFGVSAESVYLSPAPLYHAAPLRFTMGVHRLGGTSVIMEHFDAEEFLALVERHHITHSQVVPTMFVRMLKLPDEVRNRYDVSSLQVVIHAAAPCPVQVKKQMIEWFGPVLHEYYAGTEGNGFVYCNSEMWLAHEGTVGMPIGSTVHIVGEDGEEVPQGESGTIYFEGGGAFEYHNDPDKTKNSRHPKGWSTLGDVGYLDGDGFLYLTDRKAYMIISGGVNIYPQESENLLVTHPKVVDVAVFGVPNDDFGEEVKAVVQPVEMPADSQAAATLERELIAYCREHLADVKCPRSVDFRAELPRHPTGKLYKRLLKDEYWKDAGRSI
jgi:long-chain acyl-CoA synthetase